MKVVFVILLIIGVIIGLSAVNIYMTPCHDRLVMANYGSGYEIIITKSNISRIIKNLDKFWERELKLF